MMKINSKLMVCLAFVPLLFAAPTLLAYPSWTNFSYTDWSPGVDPAIAGSSGNRHYDNRLGWDGNKFVTIQGMDQSAPDWYSLWRVSSTNGREWGNPAALDVPRSWNIGHHALACDPDGFPPADTAWTEESGNVKFKLWYAAYGDNDHYRYSESTDGIYWHPFLEYNYCPPHYKVSDFNPGSWPYTTKVMIKPDVLYTNGSSNLVLSNPMEYRYLCYLGAGSDGSGGPGYFEMYISSNGLDWKLYAWDDQCQTRWETYTTAPAEVTEFITFTGWSAGQAQPSQIYTSSIEEVYENGEVQGYMLWLDRYTDGIYSYYSTNGFNWMLREEPINTIGTTTTGTAWNSSRNYGFDSVRLGESYFILRNGYYNTGGAGREGPISAEVETPSSPASGNITIDYRLFQWDNQSTPIVYFSFSTDGASWSAASRAGGDTSPFEASIGGYSHTFIWDSRTDLPSGEGSVYFRVQPWATPALGAYDTTASFEVSQAATPTPTPKPSPTPTVNPPSTATPSPTVTSGLGSRTPTPSPSPSPTSTPTPVFRPPWIYDYDGDGTSEVAVFRSGNGLWAIRGLTRLYYGSSSDRPVPADYDGNGTTEVAIFRPGSGLWAIRDLSRLYFGGSLDTEAPGDYSGDGTAAPAIFRPSQSLWAIHGLTRIYYGSSSDRSISGYYGGSTARDVAVFRGSNGLWAVRYLSRFYFGSSGDGLVPGDYNAGRSWQAGIFREANGLWAIRGISRFYFGRTADLPEPADYNGDGIDESGIFRDKSGLWAIKGLSRIYFGSSGDIPVTR